MNHRKKVKTAGIALLIVSILGMLCSTLIYGFGQFSSYKAKKFAEGDRQKLIKRITKTFDNGSIYENQKFKEEIKNSSQYEQELIKEIYKPESSIGILNGFIFINTHRKWHQLSLNYNFILALVIGIILCLIAKSWIKVQPFDPKSIRYWKVLGMILLLCNIPSFIINDHFFPAPPIASLNETLVSAFIFLLPSLSLWSVLSSLTIGVICLTVGFILENGRQAMEEQEHTV